MSSAASFSTTRAARSRERASPSERRCRSTSSFRTRATVLAVSGADGGFHAAGLAPGAYELLARAPGYVDLLADLSVPAEPELHLEMERALELAGRVTTPNHKSVGRIQLYVQRRIPSRRMTEEQARKYRLHGGIHDLWTDEHGAFRIGGLKRGLYGINVGGSFGGPNIARTRFDQIPAGTTDLELVVQPGLEIRGRILDPEGGRIPGVYVFARSEEQGGGTTGRTARSDAEGRFRITGLRPGPYTLRMMIHGERGQRVEERRHVAAGTMNLVVRDVDRTFLEIRGRLFDETGKAAGDVKLRAVPLGGTTPEAPLRAVTDSAGRFVFRGLRSVSYRIRIEDERFADRLVGGGESVRAGARDIALHMVGGARIVGLVTDAAGRALEGAVVLAQTPDGVLRRRASTNVHGRFEVTGLPRWSALTLKVSLRKYATEVRKGVQAKATTLGFVLRRGRLTSGRVVNDNGEAVTRHALLFLPVEGDDTEAACWTDEKGRFSSKELLDRDYRVLLRFFVAGKQRTEDLGTIRGGRRDLELIARALPGH